MAKTKIEVDLIINGGDTVGQVEQKTKSLKSELRSMKELLASGTLDKGKFAELSVKAGQLQDKIGDVNQQVKNLSSDARKLDAFVSVTQGIVGGFAAVQGITALVGDENEDLQKTMVKLQGAMAALNGLQAVAATLNKSSAASTTLMTFAQARYTAVVGGTTGALKLLRIAGAALGIGLIIAGIALLISKFDKIKETVTKFLPDLSKLTAFFKDAWNAITDFIGVTSEATRAVELLNEASIKKNGELENEIKILEAVGNKEEQIYRKRALMISNEILALERKKLLNKVSHEEYLKQLAELNTNAAVLDAQYQKQKDDDAKKAADKANADAKKRNEDARKIEEERVKQVLADEQVRVDEMIVFDEWEKGLEVENEKRQQAELEAIVHDEAITERENLFRQQKADLDRQAKAEELQREQDLRDAKVSIANDYFSSANALGEAVLGAQFKQTAAGKVLALAQIATDTAVAISALVRNSQANPANAPTGGIAGAVQFAAGIAQITTNIAKARSILTGGGTPSSGGSGGGGGSTPNSQPPNIRGFIPQSREKKDGITKVVVLEKDITDAVNKVARIRTNATLV